MLRLNQATQKKKGPVCALSLHEAYVHARPRSLLFLEKTAALTEMRVVFCVMVLPGPIPSRWFIDEGPRTHNKSATHPDHDAVVPLEFGEKKVPANDLRLVQGAKATQHFYVALGWDVGHCADSERRKDAACAGRRDAAGGWRRVTSERGPNTRSKYTDKRRQRLQMGSGEGRRARWFNSERAGELFLRSWMMMMVVVVFFFFFFFRRSEADLMRRKPDESSLHH